MVVGWGRVSQHQCSMYMAEAADACPYQRFQLVDVDVYECAAVQQRMIVGQRLIQRSIASRYLRMLGSC